eukprot:COSAG06_NODE_209_length_20178_cov_4.309478_10_plen_281_part_00
MRFKSRLRLQEPCFDGFTSKAVRLVRRSVSASQPSLAHPRPAEGVVVRIAAEQRAASSGARAFGVGLGSLPRSLSYTAFHLASNDLGLRSLLRGRWRGYHAEAERQATELLAREKNEARGLKELVLSGKECLGDDPGEAELARAIGEGLPPTLEQLNLQYTNLVDESLVGLLPSLATLPRLRVLVISSNELTTQGYTALAEVLPRMAALETLLASSNKRAGSAGVLSVARAVPQAPNLRRGVWLQNCGADERAQAKAAQILRDCGVETVKVARGRSTTRK